ncbi:DsbA family protein [Luedemannella helvata]|uniref:Thioredoxin-like fold domain-containing protein n=1 Tax=Luedemannella helvata TaxID=349315 RepID=A0ABN2JZT5_9ACTN
MGVQARTRAREIRAAREAEQRRAAKRKRIMSTVGGVVIVGLVLAIVVAVVKAASGGDEKSTATTPTAAVVAPAGATTGGALTVGQAGAPVRVEIYLDYMCPYCGRFERANAGELNRLVADGTVRLELYPLAFLDRMSQGSEYSTRAANAVATVADRAPDKVLAVNQALYEHQPEEGTTGLTDDQIATLARDAGVPGEVVAAFHENRFRSWIAVSTEKVLSGDVTGTPTVKINGTVFKGDLYTAGPLTQAIVAAKATG